MARRYVQSYLLRTKRMDDSYFSIPEISNAILKTLTTEYALLLCGESTPSLLPMSWKNWPRRRQSRRDHQQAKSRWRRVPPLEFAQAVP